MKATCPKCGFSADAPESMNGKTIQCPKCQEKFTCGEASPFTVVEEAPAKAEPSKHVVEEKELASITMENGNLVLTNKHLRGRVTTVFHNEKGRVTSTRVENIDVLLNGIVSTSVTEVGGKNFACTIAGGIMLMILGIIALLCASADGEPGPAMFGVALLVGGVLLMIFGPKKQRLFSLSIMGTSMSIPVSQEEEPNCEKFIEQLRAAKARYEEGL